MTRRRQGEKFDFIFGVILMFGLAACSNKPVEKVPETPATAATTVTTTPPATAEAAQHPGSLSKEAAQMRASQVANIRYQLQIDLDQKDKNFKGEETIAFDLLKADQDLRVDFNGGEVSALEVNGQPMTAAYNKQYLVIPKAMLKVGPTQIKLSFQHEYSRRGEGLSRFNDPIDKNTYVSTQFEPYGANQVFPCFDQPDLKATYELQVKAPKTWEVISTMRESQVVTDNEFRLWTFPKSFLISTYVFSLHAGPFSKWEDKKFRIPLRLFARKTLAPFVKAEEWFAITRFGLDFFESYFKTPYPFAKYDQLLIPEFSSGAMENVAAITFTERVVPRGEMSRQLRRGRDGTILHEMAHMWFGNLVTMKWWGDLWLNESFASYMADVASSHHPEYPETWRLFYSGKREAYYDDQMPTTHPVAGQVHNTDEALTNFDSITYQKGASILKQLNYVITEGVFQSALQIYFKRHAFQNAEYADFMKAIGEAANQNFAQWQKAWFETAGLNTIATQLECRDGKISKLSFAQSAASGNVPARPHAVEVTLMNRANGKVRVTEIFRADLDGPLTQVNAAVGKTCPHVVYPNHSDLGYLKVRLDDRSINNLKYSINEVEDPLLRSQLWASLWDKVEDAELPFVAFAELVVPEALAKERDELILGQLLHYTRNLVNYYHHHEILARSELPELKTKIDQILWLRINQRKIPKAERFRLFEGLRQLTASKTGVQNLKRWLRGAVKVPEIQLDSDRRWQLITQISASGDPDAVALVETEIKRDPSSIGQEYRIGALAARPDLKEKEKWLKELKKDKPTLSYSQLRRAIWNMFPTGQEDLRDQYAKQFFEDVLWINDHRSVWESSEFAYLSPSGCSKQTAGMNEEFLSRQSSLNPGVTKSLKNQAEKGRRCQRIVALVEGGRKFGDDQKPSTSKPR